MAAVSLLWCSVLFAPMRAEHYVSPSLLASTLWQHWPGVDNPVAEIFGERASGREPAPSPPIATAGCEKILTMGNGSGAAWPMPCGAAPAEMSAECRFDGVFCYANRNGTSYRFVRAPSTPYWRAIMTRKNDGTPERHSTPPAAFVLPSDRPPNPTAWLDSGWSYVERTEASTAQPAMAWRWMADRAQMRVLSAASTEARLRIVVRAFAKTRRLRISVGDADVAQFDVAESPREYETGSFRVPAGATTLTFESLDGADAAPDGARRLGIALFHVEIVSADR
jgi:hypothetical protein